MLTYLRQTAKRPGMYFGSASINDLRKHLDGWQAHRRLVNDNDQFAQLFFDSFHGFIEHYYKDNRTIGWDGLIGSYEPSERHLPVFYELLEDFVAQHGDMNA